MNDRLEEAKERPAAHAQRHGGVSGTGSAAGVSGVSGAGRVGSAGGAVGWVTAHRLLAGEPVGPAADGLRALLASACAPASAAERSQASLNGLLDAYRQAVITPTPSASARPVPGSPVGGRVPRRIGRAMAVKCSGVLLVAVGTGAAAAGSDMLPASIQRIAHHYFGGLGIPAPSASPGSPGANTRASATPQPSGSANPPAGATPISDLITLCSEIQRGSANWRTGLDAADQATLTAAAGGDQKVTPYCAQLLADTAAGKTPSPGATDSVSANASAGSGSGKSHGNGHDTHSPSPNPHATNH